MQSEQNQTCKFLLVGDPKVGKSCYGNMLTGGEYSENYISNYNCEPYMVKYESINIEIWEVPDSKDPKICVPEIDGFIIMADINSNSSVLRVHHKRKYLIEKYGNLPNIVILNKFDHGDFMILGETKFVISLRNHEDKIFMPILRLLQLCSK